MLLRSTLIYAPAIVLTRVSALLLLVIATRLISQSEYGLLTLVVTIGEMTDTTVTSWLRIALLRLGGKGEISRGSLLLAGRVLVGTSAVGLVVAAMASRLIVPDRWLEFAIAVCTYLIASSIGRFALTILQMQRRHTAYALLEFLRAVLQLVLPIAAIGLFHQSFLLMSLGSSLGVLLAALVALTLALKDLVPGPARFTHRAFLLFGLPLIVIALMGFGLNNAERIFLKLYYDAGAVAIFASAYALARQPIDTVANAINMGGFPELVSLFDTDGPKAAGQFLSNLLGLLVRLCLPVAGLLIVLSSDITALALPAAYHGQLDRLFPIIAVSVLCANITSFVYENVVHAHKQPWLLGIPVALGSVATIALSLYLIPSLSAEGAALALAGGSLVSLVACMSISHRLTPVPLPWRHLAISLVIALGTALAAGMVDRASGGAPVPLRLAAAGAAGGLTFLVLNGLFDPTATLQLAGRLRLRLRAA